MKSERERERGPEREEGGIERIAMGKRGGGSDVDAEGEVGKVNPELECERNDGNGGVFLWLETEGERRRRIGREGGSRPEALQNTPPNVFPPSLLPSLSLLCAHR